MRSERKTGLMWTRVIHATESALYGSGVCRIIVKLCGDEAVNDAQHAAP